MRKSIGLLRQSSDLLVPQSTSFGPILAEAFVERPEDLLALYLLGPDGVENWVESDRSFNSPLNTDERNFLEFHVPRFVNSGPELARENLNMLRKLGSSDPVTGYLSGSLKEPSFIHHLAARNLYFGDFWEALALVEGDTSAEGEALRKKILLEMELFKDAQVRDEK